MLGTGPRFWAASSEKTNIFFSSPSTKSSGGGRPFVGRS